MQYESSSICYLAEVRHMELQTEAARYRSGHPEVGLVPTFQDIMVAAAKGLGRAWVCIRYGLPPRAIRGRQSIASSLTASEALINRSS
jgi:hypothetical protein